jgi:polyisoprenoid-binding protein YceI
MASPGRYEIGPQRATLTVHTGRAGAAAVAGHDLTLEVTRWHGELVIAPDLQDSTVTVAVEASSLRVLSGTGGLKPLSDRDKREIAATTRRLLDTDRHPTITFAARPVATTDDGGTLEGTLHLLGHERPLRLTVTRLPDGGYTATGTLLQSAYGIKPYTTLFGTLRLADPVTIHAHLPANLT